MSFSDSHLNELGFALPTGFSDEKFWSPELTQEIRFGSLGNRKHLNVSYPISTTHQVG